jgi:hypothetical protein
MSSAHHAELVSPRICEHCPGLGAGLADVHSLCPERQKAFDLGFPIVNAGRQVQVHAVFDGLRDRHGHEAHADRISSC